MSLRIRDVMSRNLRTGLTDDDLSSAEQKMVAGAVRHLPVLDNEGGIAGIVTQRSLLRHRATLPQHEVDEHHLSDVMERDVATTEPDADLDDVGKLMAERRIGSVLVVDGGELVGIVTTTDVLAARRYREVAAAGVTQATVGEVMRREPPSVLRDENLVDAARRMHRERLTFLPIVDEEGRALGLLTERELRLAVGDPFEAVEERMASLGDFTAETAMSPAPLVSPDDQLPRALFHLSGEFNDAVLVTDDDENLLGMVTYLDVLDFLTRA